MDAKEKKNKVFKITLVLFLVTGTMVAYYAYQQKQYQISELTEKYGVLSNTLVHRDSVVNEFVIAFDEVERTLDSISMKRNKFSVIEYEGRQNQQQRIVNGITQLDAMIEHSTRQIAQLESKLKKSNLDLGAFQKRLTSLNSRLEAQNAEIAELRTEIEVRDDVIFAMKNRMYEMEDEITIANDSLQLQHKMILNREEQMNTAYLAFGTYSELKEKGLVRREGGFLNIGGSKTINTDFDPELFTPLNKRDFKEIPILSKKVIIISEHPENSYHFVEDSGLITALHIEDPEEFWKISNYALIEIK